MQEPFLERLVLLGVEPEPLGDVHHVDGDVATAISSSSAKLPSRRPNTTMAPRSRTSDTPRTTRSAATNQWIPYLARTPLGILCRGEGPVVNVYRGWAMFQKTRWNDITTGVTGFGKYTQINRMPGCVFHEVVVYSSREA